MFSINCKKTEQWNLAWPKVIAKYAKWFYFAFVKRQECGLASRQYYYIFNTEICSTVEGGDVLPRRPDNGSKWREAYPFTFQSTHTKYCWSFILVRNPFLTDKNAIDSKRFEEDILKRNYSRFHRYDDYSRVTHTHKKVRERHFTQLQDSLTIQVASIYIEYPLTSAASFFISFNFKSI